MFELTNEQRKCFGLPPVLEHWKRIELKPSPYDTFVTYAFLDGNHIVKVIQVSDLPDQCMYREYGMDQMLSESGKQILPKTEKGKPQKFTSAVLMKKTPVGIGLLFYRDHVDIFNFTADQHYYRSCYESLKIKYLDDFAAWVEEWCCNTGEKELAEIHAFAQRTREHQKFREGDFFRYRIKRNLYGYGRILVDYAKMRKEKIPFWDAFMGKPLCVAVYHIATKDENVTPEMLVSLKMMPAIMIMDNAFYYGECEIIGNMPITFEEENCPIHYGESFDAHKRDHICFQQGKTFVTLENEKLLYDCDFKNMAIGWDLEVELPILSECIRKNSNEPYWDMIHPYQANRDLRNPKFKKELKAIKAQMGMK